MAIAQSQTHSRISADPCLAIMLPPGPSQPALIQTLRIITQPVSFLLSCADRYGDWFTLRVLGPQSPPVVFVSDPEAILAIFGTLADQLELGRIADVFRPLVGNESLIMQNGDRHRQQRQILMPALQGERLFDYTPAMRAITEAAIAEWPLGQSLDLRRQMSHISLAVILQVVFGLTPGPRYRDLYHRLDHLLEAITDPLYSLQFFWPALQQDWGNWSPWGRFCRHREAIDALITAEIQEGRQSQQPRQDVLELLLAARDREGQPLSDQELRDQLMTLLLLGHETTASALTWAVFWLLRHPDCLARLQAELAAIGPNDRAIAKAPYLDAVCREALRLQPIALIAQPRLVATPLSLGGYDFASGTILVPCVMTAHRRAETYPNPEQFQPDRFLERRFSNGEFLPFGGGQRSCIGMALSLIEMKVVLATLLRRCQLAEVSRQPVRPLRRGITFVPSHHFRIQVQQWHNPSAQTAIASV